MRFPDLMGGDEEPDDGPPESSGTGTGAPAPGVPGTVGQEVADDDAAAAAEALARLAGLAAEPARTEGAAPAVPATHDRSAPLTLPPDTGALEAASAVEAIEVEDVEEPAHPARDTLDDDLLPRRKRRRR